MKRSKIGKESNRIIAALTALKNSALFSMFFNPSYGQTITEDDLSSKEKAQELATASGLSMAEMKIIRDGFSAANSNLARREQSLEVPKRNPFQVSKKDLKFSSGKQPQEQQVSVSKGREIVDD